MEKSKLCSPRKVTVDIDGVPFVLYETRGKLYARFMLEFNEAEQNVGVLAGKNPALATEMVLDALREEKEIPRPLTAKVISDYYEEMPGPTFLALLVALVRHNFGLLNPDGSPKSDPPQGLPESSPAPKSSSDTTGS